MKLLRFLLIIGLTVVVIVAVQPSLQAQTEDSTFTIAVLPDTQVYSWMYPDIFMAQTSWIAENHQTAGVAFTVHLGDVVDHVRAEREWVAASAAMQVLDDAGLPYSILAGNHDVRYRDEWDDERRVDREPFLQYFPAERISSHDTYGAHTDNGFNAYYIFEGGGQSFLVFAIDWRAGIETIDWVKDALAAHPTLPAIVTTHQLINVNADDGSAFLTTYGAYLWDELIAESDQIFLTINGHHHGVAHTVLQNSFGNDVILMLVDYQGDFQGGNGMMRLLEFDLAANTIDVVSFSPWVQALPTDERTAEDQAAKDDPQNRFTLNIDFAERFTFAVATPD